MPNYRAWFKIDPFDSTPCKLEEGWVPVMELEASDPDMVFMAMQGENWSPNGEARQAIEDLGLSHTSMMVGDVIENLDTGRMIVVESVGFDVFPKED